MKGVIAQCLAELVIENFGRDKWEAALEKSGLNKNTVFLATQDVNDKDVLNIVGSVCQVLKITLPQAADAFGDYWVNKFAPKIYSAYYMGVKSAREMLLKMDSVHLNTTKTMANARPPRFNYTWYDDKTLIMTYNSERGLIDFLVGLVKGVGKHFNEHLEVTKLSNNKVKIVFEK
ncbi:MAG: heme NO-binding domain-containing protein [Bacillota bacterium]